MKLIIGLGNPGKQYTNTRHNVGFIILDEFMFNKKWEIYNDYEMITDVINGEKVIFMKPLTYMNLSGTAVVKVVNYFKIDTTDILVIHDDLDLAVGRVKFKFNSSSGGHNGVQNIIECISSKNFSQMKIGIGKNKIIDTKDYVLGKLSNDEINNIKQYGVEMLNFYINNGINKTMEYYNKK